jgi:cysteine synthase A
MRARGQRGSIVSLLCDRGERYAQTLFDPSWLAAHDIDTAPWDAALRASLATGSTPMPTSPTA